MAMKIFLIEQVSKNIKIREWVMVKRWRSEHGAYVLLNNELNHYF